MNPVVKWLLTLMLWAAPPAKAHQFPGYIETVEQRTARYQSIAEDIFVVVDKAKPHLFSKQKNALMVLAVAIGESALDLDADKGPCFRGLHEGVDYRRRCDGGHAVGALQLWTALPEDRAPLFADRRKMLEIGLRGMAGSFRACPHLPIEERLAAYGSGRCDVAAARAGSRKRYALFVRLLDAKPIPAWPVPEKAKEAPPAPDAPRAPAKVAER